MSSLPLITILRERFRVIDFSENVHFTCQMNHCRACNYTERYTAGSSLVYGYPSTGGILAKSVDALELVHLGLDRFNNAWRSGDIVKEDEFCNDLHHIGAGWWPYKVACGCPELDKVDIVNQRIKIETGWPETGGVWVLKCPSRFRERYDVSTEMERKLWKLKLVLNMDEKSQILKELGAEFYEDPDDCEDLRPLRYEGAVAEEVFNPILQYIAPYGT